MPQPVSEVIPPQPDTSAQLREMQQQILVKRLADAEGRIADLEHENMRLTEQVSSRGATVEHQQYLLIFCPATLF